MTVSLGTFYLQGLEVPPTTKINTMFTNMEGDGKGFYSPTKHSIAYGYYHQQSLNDAVGKGQPLQL